jgi:hypothetical protein
MNERAFVADEVVVSATGSAAPRDDGHPDEPAPGRATTYACAVSAEVHDSDGE